MADRWGPGKTTILMLGWIPVVSVPNSGYTRPMRAIAKEISNSPGLLFSDSRIFPTCRKHTTPLFIKEIQRAAGGIKDVWAELKAALRMSRFKLLARSLQDRLSTPAPLSQVAWRITYLQATDGSYPIRARWMEEAFSKSPTE